MSNTTQNLNEAHFTPDYTSDDNGIAYSCGHINPLQRAIQDAVVKIKDVRLTLTNITVSLSDANYELELIANDFIDFSKNRLEAIRDINSDLRDYIGDFENKKEDLISEITSDFESEKEDLNSEIKELNNKVENLTQKLQALEAKHSQISKKFEIVTDIVNDLHEL